MNHNEMVSHANDTQRFLIFTCHHFNRIAKRKSQKFQNMSWNTWVGMVYKYMYVAWTMATMDVINPYSPVSNSSQQTRHTATSATCHISFLTHCTCRTVALFGISGLWPTFFGWRWLKLKQLSPIDWLVDGIIFPLLGVGLERASHGSEPSRIPMVIWS